MPRKNYDVKARFSNLRNERNSWQVIGFAYLLPLSVVMELIHQNPQFYFRLCDLTGCLSVIYLRDWDVDFVVGNG